MFFPTTQKHTHESKKSLRIQPIVGLNFPSSIRTIKETRDGNYLIICGGYPPQIYCFDLHQLNLKFQRTVDCDIVDYQTVSSNWEKLVLLRSDKYLEFHSKSGYYYQCKLIKAGHALLFDHEKTKNIYIPVADRSGEIIRFNLEKGKFLTSLNGIPGEINSSSCKNISHTLLAFGKSNGMVELWDTRQTKKPVRFINSLLYFPKKEKNPVTYLSFPENFSSHRLYSGFSSGHVLIYDLRSSAPILSKKISNNSAIKMIYKAEQFKEWILSVDQKTIKVWNEQNGKTLLNIKSSSKKIYYKHKFINNVCPIQHTGFILIVSGNNGMANGLVDGRYIPCLGPLPRWCFPYSFSKSLIENSGKNGKAFNYQEKMKNSYSNSNQKKILDILNDRV